MSEAEKQEGQKTVVAFITGLLIGGLLVWVFSTPAEAPVETTEETEVATEIETNTTDTESPAATSEMVVSQDKGGIARPTVQGTGSIKVSNQKEGAVVVIDSAEYPSEHGWVVVRDFNNGVAGNVLGAARFNSNEGLTPTSVNLLRETEAGKTYQVVFYNETADKNFDLKADVLVDNISTTFTAN